MGAVLTEKRWTSIVNDTEGSQVGTLATDEEIKCGHIN